MSVDLSDTARQTFELDPACMMPNRGYAVAHAIGR